MLRPSYQFYKLFPGIYAVAYADPIALSATFWRAQEFYESASDDFRGKKFDFKTYAKWYADTQSPTGTFSYYKDWKGFNLPSTSIEECYRLHDERLEADEVFLSIVAECRKQAAIDQVDNYYLLGVSQGDLATLDHEIAHGLYFTSPDYRQDMLQAIAQTSPSLVNMMRQTILDYGYNEAVLDDEAQAYWATGLGVRMLDVELNIPCYHFNHIFKKYVSNWQLPSPIFTT